MLESIQKREIEETEQPALSEETLRNFPPSVKLVVKVLEVEGPMTQKELSNETRLAQRTVREATSQLEEDDLVEQQVYIPDARQRLYSLTVPHS